MLIVGLEFNFIKISSSIIFLLMALVAEIVGTVFGNLLNRMDSFLPDQT